MCVRAPWLCPACKVAAFEWPNDAELTKQYVALLRCWAREVTRHPEVGLRLCMESPEADFASPSAGAVEQVQEPTGWTANRSGAGQPAKLRRRRFELLVPTHKLVDLADAVQA